MKTKQKTHFQIIERGKNSARKSHGASHQTSQVVVESRRARTAEGHGEVDGPTASTRLRACLTLNPLPLSRPAPLRQSANQPRVSPPVRPKSNLPKLSPSSSRALQRLTPRLHTLSLTSRAKIFSLHHAGPSERKGTWPGWVRGQNESIYEEGHEVRETW